MFEDIINKAFKDLNDGKFILIYDKDGREEEVDLICLAEKVTAKHIYKLRNDAGGLICIAMHANIAKVLGLPFMTEIYSKVKGDFKVFNSISRGEVCPYGDRPSFSITINHTNTYTGITDIDRALTIREFGILSANIYKNGVESDLLIKSFNSNFRAPGHVHLLIAHDNLLSERMGHTELSVSLAYMGNLTPATVLCEMLDKDNGKALSIEKAKEYAEKNNLIMIKGNDILKVFEKFKRENC
ncbi:MAG: 3,4-dihydroxy-2-butanone-4-phosphate synthase [Candidatus Lokiarchaeota archaeon]|nr:3,4-dihydroxy-2-butanone-4-phosphate synthase [Candidatus Lokiarchaeota archaeon]